MADDQEVQISEQVMPDKVENDGTIDIIVEDVNNVSNGEIKNPDDGLQDNTTEQPQHEVSESNVEITSSPINNVSPEKIEQNNTDGSDTTAIGVEEAGTEVKETTAGDVVEETATEANNETATEANNETATEVNNETATEAKDETATEAKDEMAAGINEEMLTTVENNEEPEIENGPLMDPVTQPLSREGSPTLQEEPVVAEIPDASQTPPPLLLEGEEIDENQMVNIISNGNDEIQSIASSIEIPVYNRAELIERYQQAIEERSSLQSLNSQLQHKLAEYFKKKKTDERQQEIEKNASDQEQRYIKYLANLEELQGEQAREQESYKEQIEELKEHCFEKQNKVTEASEEFTKHKCNVARQAVNSRSGRPIPTKDIEQYQQQEQRKDHDVTLVRLENIKLKNRLKKREMQLKAKEELAEGLHLIDFEQLKIENQTYNEKIEERNEELLKLRKKITTTVQVLTHLKEKLQFVQGENVEQRGNLKTVDVQVAQKRDVLTRTKQARDALRIDNVKLRQKCGLLGNEPLLRDYEDRKDEAYVIRK